MTSTLVTLWVRMVNVCVGTDVSFESLRMSSQTRILALKVQTSKSDSPAQMALFMSYLRGPAINKPQLPDALNEKGTYAAKKLVVRLNFRMGPYLPTLRSFELLDLSVQNSDVLPIVESTWAAMESMVIRSNPGFERFGFEPINFPVLKTQMNAWRKKAGKLDGPE